MNPSRETSRARLLDNLQRLIGDIAAYAAGEKTCQARQAKPHQEVSSMAKSMPLGHSSGTAPFHRIAKVGSILSREELQHRGVEPAGGTTEQALGTLSYVFTYVGPLRYPGTSCGFYFRPKTEETFADGAIATPFDSGGVKYLRPTDSLDERIVYVRRNELPVPDYREYFARCLALLYYSPWDYVDGKGPDMAGPIEVRGGDARRWTFEARFKGELPLSGSLSAVILPGAVGALLASEVAAWKTAGVVVIYYPTPDPNEATSWQFLLDKSVDYVRECVQNA